MSFNVFTDIINNTDETMRQYDDWLAAEADWLNGEFERLFGSLPGDTGLQRGSPMTLVHATQSKIFRHYIEELKKNV